MTWEQKLAAMDALAGAPARIVMRQPGNWLCSHRIDVKDRACLRGGCGNGPTVEEAVLNQWQRLTTGLRPHEYLVVESGEQPRRAARWNGFMWATVDENAEAAA